MSDTILSQAAIYASTLDVTGPSNHWLCADPVHIVTDQHHAFLIDHVVLSDDETISLLLDINEFLFEQEYVLFAPSDQKWLLNLPAQPDISTVPLDQMKGCDIAEKLPTGAEQVAWRQLFTELQMLLYTHSVNEHRRKQHLPTVDALWFWGEVPETPHTKNKKRKGWWRFW